MRVEILAIFSMQAVTTIYSINLLFIMKMLLITNNASVWAPCIGSRYTGDIMIIFPIDTKYIRKNSSYGSAYFKTNESKYSINGFDAKFEILILCAGWAGMNLKRIKLIGDLLQLEVVTYWLILGTKCN